MQFDKYQKLAMRTKNKTLIHREQLTNICFGLVGEVGEVVDLVKKHLDQRHPLSQDKIAEELGDVLWYLAEACDTVGVSLHTVACANIAKLEARYPSLTFSAEQSVARKE